MSRLDRTTIPEPSAITPYDFPAVRRMDHGNGLTHFTSRHGRVPMVSVAAVFDAGAERDPAGAHGVAHLVANGLESGTRDLSAEEVAWRLERLGIELRTFAGWDAASARMSVHRDRLEPALELFAELIRRPVFPDDEIRRLRDEQIADILQRAKDPGALAADMAARFIFPREHTYGRPLIGSAESVGAIDPERARHFHARHYVPGGSAVITTGDIGADEAETLIDRYFGDWSGRAPDPVGDDASHAVERTTIFIVDRPGAVQSEIRIGHVGVQRHHPDYFPLLLMNTVLGGAFTSRLNMNLRERHGFTYGARSGFAFRRRPGPFLVSAAVGTEVTAAAVREAIAEIDTLRMEGATEDEVASARLYLAGVMPLELQTNEQLAARLADLFIFDLPADYFDRYPERILAVTRDEVDRVAREQLQPDRAAIIIIGDASVIEAPLRALGLGDVEVHTTESTASEAQ